MLFDLDGEVERSAFLIWNDRWTILVFSKYEEEARLLRELQTWSPVTLYLWVQDSDVWGYDMLDEQGFVASHNSDPRTYRSFADEEVPRPKADPGDVARRLQRPELEKELRDVHRKRAIFAEDVCAELCRVLGAEGAAVSYDDLECGHADNLDGWNVEQLLFFHRDSMAPPACGTDLHGVDLGAIGVPAGTTTQTQITPDMRAEVEQMRRRAHLRVLLLRPVSWIARGWRRGLEQLAPKRPGNLPAGAQPGATRQARGSASASSELFNARHDTYISPSPGMLPQPVSGRPALVYAFRAGSTPVTCTARRIWKIADILRPPRSSEVLRDEKYHTRSGLKARHLLFKLPPRYMAGGVDPSFLGLHVIETRQALYVFLYRFSAQIEPEIEDEIRLTVMSFRWIDRLALTE